MVSPDNKFNYKRELIGGFGDHHSSRKVISARRPAIPTVVDNLAARDSHSDSVIDLHFPSMQHFTRDISLGLGLGLGLDISRVRSRSQMYEFQRRKVGSVSTVHWLFG